MQDVGTCLRSFQAERGLQSLVVTGPVSELAVVERAGKYQNSSLYSRQQKQKISWWCDGCYSGISKLVPFSSRQLVYPKNQCSHPEHGRCLGCTITAKTDSA